MFLIILISSVLFNYCNATTNTTVEKNIQQQSKPNTKKKLSKEEMKKLEETRNKIMMMLQQKMKNLDMNKIYDTYNKRPLMNPNTSSIQDRVYGKKNTKHKLLVFSDFACTHCANASNNLRARVDENKDAVNLNYIFFPLDKDCNKNLKGKLSDYSCPAFKMALCSEKEGKLKEAISYLYDNKPVISKDKKFDANVFLNTMQKTLGLKDIRTCMSSDWLKKKIETENNIYKGIKIKGTPIILLDGKELPPVYKSKELFKQFLKTIELKENSNRR